MIRILTGLAADGEIQYKKVTPKRLAQQIIVDTLRVKLEFLDEGGECPEMTEREAALVREQMYKLTARVYKMMGFTE